MTDVRPADCKMVWDAADGSGLVKCHVTHRDTGLITTGFGTTTTLAMEDGLQAITLLVNLKKQHKEARDGLQASFDRPVANPDRVAVAGAGWGEIAPVIDTRGLWQRDAIVPKVVFPQDLHGRRPIDEVKARRALHKQYKEARARIAELERELASARARNVELKNELAGNRAMYALALDVLDLKD